MRHVEKALNGLSNDIRQFIKIENVEDIKGIAPIVCFSIQSDPISEVGKNGLQAVDIIEYSRNLIKSLDDQYPCEENKKTIIFLTKAIESQQERTNNRMKRNVEGYNLL